MSAEEAGLIAYLERVQASMPAPMSEGEAVIVAEWWNGFNTPHRLPDAWDLAVRKWANRSR